MSKGISFEIKPSPIKNLKLPIEESLFIIVLSNLIDNAIDATKKFEGNRVVKLHLFDNKSDTSISVTNTGQEIPFQLIPKIFKRGFTTKENKDSHGYGLYNVKRILDQNGYSIEVLSENNSTTFQVNFNHKVTPP